MKRGVSCICLLILIIGVCGSSFAADGNFGYGYDSAIGGVFAGEQKVAERFGLGVDMTISKGSVPFVALRTRFYLQDNLTGPFAGFRLGAVSTSTTQPPSLGAQLGYSAILWNSMQAQGYISHDTYSPYTTLGAALLVLW